MNKEYHIHREGDAFTDLGGVTVTVKELVEDALVNEYELTPEDSLKVSNHSPTGFEFGYGGSGPAQLALAILMDYTEQMPDKWSNPWNYQGFKWEFISAMKHPGGTITGGQIDEWLKENPTG